MSGADTKILLERLTCLLRTVVLLDRWGCLLHYCISARQVEKLLRVIGGFTRQVDMHLSFCKQAQGAGGRWADFSVVDLTGGRVSVSLGRRDRQHEQAPVGSRPSKQVDSLS
jgi:hypothetical protein